HAPFALRTIVEIETDAGVTGVAETYGGEAPLRAFARARPLVLGRDPWELTRIRVDIEKAERVTGNGHAWEARKLRAPALFAAIEVLREAFPRVPLRLDPNAAWSRATAHRVAKRLAGALEYLEDPVPGLDAMAEVAATAPMPLATNMCVTAFEHVPEAVAKRAVGIILSDHHMWGGMRATVELGRLCGAFGPGLSMHSNSHLGISLAAMVHVAAAVPELAYACDTHYPWQIDDVIKGGKLRIENGEVAVPTGPGLGVELDRDALGRLHEQYTRSGLTVRDD